MSIQWIQTKYPGVRYREHKTRRHGVRKDRYFTIRYYLDDGKRKEEGLGWNSDGWTAEKAVQELSELKKARRMGDGPLSLQEKRVREKHKRDEEAKLVLQKEKENVTFGQYFDDTYYPTAITSKKKPSYKKEEQHFNRWIEPVVGNIPLKDIKPFTIERIKKNMIDKGRSPRMIEYVMATIRQVWNQARRDGLISIESPTKSVKIVKKDNKRLRFLTHQEADRLLKALSIRDKQTYQIAIISLNTGMRVGEVFKLTWGDIDINQGFITVRDAKGGSRIAYMTDTLKLIFEGIRRAKNDDFIFLSPIRKKPFSEMPDIFSIIVNEIGLNKNIDDRRQKIVPHSLRHTYASWLVQDGVDLYTVQKLLGHGTIVMTQRYAHLSPGNLQEATKTLERGIIASRNIVEIESVNE